MESIKVIFLDVDGVLNSGQTVRRTTNGYLFVGRRQMRNLRRIVEETGAKVVLSSDWRYNRDDPKMNGDYLELRRELLKYGIQIYDFTPELPSAHRGAEIDEWLKNHNGVSDFVILDDRSDIEPNEDHWVRTTMVRGLGKPETEEAIRILRDGVSEYMIDEAARMIAMSVSAYIISADIDVKEMRRYERARDMAIGALHAHMNKPSDWRLTTRNQHTGKAILRNLPNYAEFDAVEKLCRYEEAEQAAILNLPLTLNELQGMDDQPVWCCDPTNVQNGHWAIVRADPSDGPEYNYCAYSVGVFWCFSDYGKSWIAYRRPLQTLKGDVNA